MNDRDATERLRVTVAYALPARQYLEDLLLPPGATVADALAVVADHEPFRALGLPDVPVGIYGERVPLDRPLADHDRVEIYRPLQVDPLDARRERLRRPR
ncbi:MAG: RnfH family protein [Pseudomonadales bacterium]|nr:RnfH family protein [Pseudomonadales bacterium]